jgi:hypothetical protein
MFQGSCLCGFVHYESPGPASHETVCHCGLCRRASGAPFVAWFSVPSESFRFTQGQPAFFDSSEHGRRGFCPRCGTPLTFRSSATPDDIDVTTCSLEDPEVLPPRDHTRTASRLRWVTLADGLPAYPGARPEASTHST